MYSAIMEINIKIYSVLVQKEISTKSFCALSFMRFDFAADTCSFERNEANINCIIQLLCRGTKLWKAVSAIFLVNLSLNILEARNGRSFCKMLIIPLISRTIFYSSAEIQLVILINVLSSYVKRDFLKYEFLTQFEFCKNFNLKNLLTECFKKCSVF